MGWAADEILGFIPLTVLTGVEMSAEIMADSSERSMDTECHAMEPEAKRQKLEPAVKPASKPEEDKLEQRLGGILCCAVCLDLPKAAVYQASVLPALQ